MAENPIKNKILVNFKTRQVINLPEHRGSSEYHNLRKQGYVEVGTITTDKEPRIYWESEYFDPEAKYGSQRKSN